MRFYTLEIFIEFDVSDILSAIYALTEGFLFVALALFFGVSLADGLDEETGVFLRFFLGEAVEISVPDSLLFMLHQNFG